MDLHTDKHMTLKYTDVNDRQYDTYTRLIEYHVTSDIFSVEGFII